MADDKLVLQEIPEPIGTWIIENGNGTMHADGMYYHYSEVCTMIMRYHVESLRKLKLIPEFKPCGEGDNTCSCKDETECGYSQKLPE